MTSIAVSSLPKIAGKAMFKSIFNVIKWTFKKLFANPLLSLIIIVMSVGSVMSVNNALFLQNQTHPAPFFAKKQDTAYNIQDTAYDIIAPMPKTISKKSLQDAPINERGAAVVSNSALENIPIPAISETIIKIDHAKVIELQTKLASLGFLNGVIDGFYGSETADAIRSFEKYTGKKPVGALTPEVAQQILNYEKLSLVQSSVKAATQPRTKVIASNIAEDPLMKIIRTAATSNSSGAEKINSPDAHLVEKVQKGLVSLGFLYGKIDGVMGEDTSRAVREFEVFYNYKLSGEVTPELLDMLKSAGAKI